MRKTKDRVCERRTVDWESWFIFDYNHQLLLFSYHINYCV